MIELIVKKEEREINRYFLPQGVTTLGRAEDNGIILDDSCVSRRHACIKVEGARVSIEDMGSGNGTFQGEARIEKKELSDGDEIVIEPFRLLLRKDKQDAKKPADSTRPVPSTRPPPSARLESPPSRAAREPGGSAAGGPRLEVVRGTGGPFLLPDDQEASIGRSDEAVITLKDPSSSRKHASVEKTRKGWLLRDLGSANGTYVNGASVKEVALADGDIILIGNTELRFVDPMAAQIAAPPTPPPSTKPVNAGRGGGPSRGKSAPAPMRYEEPEESLPRATDDMDVMDDDRNTSQPSFAGAMPGELGAGGGTEVGGPPPAFGGRGGSSSSMESTGEADLYANGGSNEGTGGYDDLSGPDANTGYDDQFGGGNDQFDNGNGGNEFGMELGEGALFPGGERPPDSLVGRYIFSLKTNGRTRLITGGVAVLFLIVLIGKSQSGPASSGGGGPSGYVRELDKQQQLTLDTMQVFERDALNAIDPAKGEQRDYGTAFERYGRIVMFANKPEMTKVLESEVLARRATDAIYTMHEALIIKRLQDVTRRGEMNDEERQKNIANFTKEGDTAYARAKKTRNVGEWGKAIKAYTALLELNPPKKDEIQARLAESKQEQGKLLGAISAAGLEKLKRDCAAMLQQGQARARRATSKDHLEAIKIFERVINMDPGNRTEYPGLAQASINASKKKLKDLARPLRDQGAAAKAKLDYLSARRSFRAARTTDPYDPTTTSELAGVQEECIRNARRQISEAKAYMAADNFEEASKSLKLAGQYADTSETKEYQQIQDLIKTIKRNTER